MSLLIKGVSAHTGLTDKDPAGTIDHANTSVTDAKIASGVGLSDTQIAKLPVAAPGLVLKRGGAAWEALAESGIAGVSARKNSQMPVVGSRPQLNFIEGASIDLIIQDNVPDTEIDITISAKYPTQFITLIPKTAVLPTVNPAAFAPVDGANFAYDVLNFDKDTEESNNWDWYLTPDYLSENIEAYIYWISAGAGNVVFGISTGCRVSGDTWDAALGTEHTVVQTNTVAGKVNVAKIDTFAPGWTSNGNVIFKLARKAAEGTDTLDADASVLKVIIRYTGQFAQSFYPLPVAIELTALVSSAWSSKDVSAYIPTGATGVILHILNTDGATEYAVGLRKKGSTDARIDKMPRSSHLWAMVGVDSSRIFQYWLDLQPTMKIYLVGYTASGVVFFDNAVEKVPAGFGSFQDLDVSAICPGAVGVILELTGDNKNAAIRNNGSSIDMHQAVLHAHAWVVCGVDGSKKFECWLSDNATHVWVVGYITSGAVFPVDGVNITPGIIDTWTETNCSGIAPSGIMLFVLSVGCGANLNQNYGLRRHDDTEAFLYSEGQSIAGGFIPCNSAQRIEAYTHRVYAVGWAAQYVMGYATWGT